jgi:tetratricopeptide (TPR) repeat protein
MPACQAAAPGDSACEKGVQAYLSRDFKTAVSELKGGLEAGVKPDDQALMWTILGNAYDELDEYEESVKAHKKSLELDANSHETWTNLGATYRHMKEYDKAESAYQESLKLSPDYPEAHASLGALYIYQGKNEEAIKSLERAIELDPGLAIARSNIAYAYAIAGRFDEAEASLAKAIELGYPNGDVIRQRIDEQKKEQGR